MKLLLDTHVFLWFIDGNTRLSGLSRQLIEDLGNERFLSTASLWEMSIKVSLGKLNMPFSFTELAVNHIEGNMINVLNITPNHLETLITLPFHHKDPFDRLIISQGKSEGMQILSCDKAFDAYGINRFWE